MLFLLTDLKSRYQEKVFLDKPRPAGRPAGRSAGGPAGRPGGARIVSSAEKKSFDRGGLVWPPRSNVTNDRLMGGRGGLCPRS